MTRENFEKIAQVMQSELEIFKTLFGHSNDKTKAIVDRNIARLEEITKTENSLAIRLGNLEIEREKQLKKVSEECGVKLELLEASKIAQIVGGEEGQKILNIKEEMILTVSDLKVVNDLNSKLIQNSLEYVDFLINIITDVSDSADNNYSAEGKPAERNSKRKMFDVKL